MCNPALIAYAVVAAVAAASAGVQASNAKDQADYEAKVADNNAIIAQQQRSIAIQNGDTEAQQRMQQAAQLFGTQRALMSAHGIDITQGTPIDILATTKMSNVNDVATIRNNAAKQAWGYEVESMNYKNEATLQKTKADSISPVGQGLLTFGTSMLSSAASYSASGGSFGGGSSATMKMRPSTGAGGWPA